MLLPTRLLLLASPLLQEGQPATETTEAPEGGGPDFFLLLIALVAVFYFVMILPEKKNRKKRERMLGALKKGDKVMTTSGLYGTVAMVKDDVITLQVADGVRLRFSRSAVQGLVEEGGGQPAKGGKADDGKEKDTAEEAKQGGEAGS